MTELGKEPLGENPAINFHRAVPYHRQQPEFLKGIDHE